MTPEREAEIRGREHREALYGTYKYDVATLLEALDAERALNARLVAALKSITSDGPIGSKCHAIDFYHDDGEACDICAALAEVQP